MSLQVKQSYPLLYGTLTPAYGRDYTSGAAALKDWNDGKDFRINCPQGSTYCSIRDTDNCPVGHTLQIRWKKCTCLAVITKQANGLFTAEFDEEEPSETYGEDYRSTNSGIE